VYLNVCISYAKGTASFFAMFDLHSQLTMIHSRAVVLYVTRSMFASFVTGGRHALNDEAAEPRAVT